MMVYWIYICIGMRLWGLCKKWVTMLAVSRLETMRVSEPILTHVDIMNNVMMDKKFIAQRELQ